MATTHGRSIEVLLAGDSTGFPLVTHHGTPCEMTMFADWHSLCLERGARLISASRPGYGESSRNSHRSVLDAAKDTAAILDQLGHRTFVTLGWSGGGPHALACAATLPGRCLAAATLGGVGEYGTGLDYLAGMGPENVDEYSAAIKGEQPLRDWLTQNATGYGSVTGKEIADALGGLVPEVDRRVLSGAVADHMAAVFRRALTHGFDGWVDDDLAFVRDWGFSLNEIRIPVSVWQGDLDRMVPVAHGRWLAGKIPNALGHIISGQGHLSLAIDYRAAIVDDLLWHGRKACCSALEPH